jgi:outer membrane protein assembly factor BamB
MRRAVVAFIVGLVAFATMVPAPTRAAVRFVASYELGDAPAWQTAVQKKERGSWVKHSSPVVADLGPHGRVILVGAQNGKLYALRYRGRELTEVWDSGSKIDTYIDSSPVVADLFGDGCPEVLVGAGNEFRPKNSGVHVFDCNGRNHRFWVAPRHEASKFGPQKLNHVGVFSTPAVGDVNGDGKPDVAYGSFNQKMYVKNRKGEDLPGWPRENFDTIWSSPALLDLNEDGRREVVVGTDLGGGAAVFGCKVGIRGTLSVFKADASYYPRFPRCIDTPIWSSPAVQDVNGDRVHDIVVGTNNYLEFNKQVGVENLVRAWDTRTGEKTWETRLPSGSRVFASPAIGDVGGDGALDVAIGTIAAKNYGEVYLLDAKTGRIRWHREGGHHTVCACQFMGSPVLGDITGDGRPEVLAASEDGGLNAWGVTGKTVIADLHAPGNSSSMFFNSPAVADLDGDGRNEIVLAGAIKSSDPLRGKVWILSTTGRGAGPWPVFKKTVDRLSSQLK